MSIDHNSDHPLDRTIPVLLSGAGVARGDLGAAHLLDIPATLLWVLGVNRPADLEGRVLYEAFESCVDAPIASAVA